MHRPAISVVVTLAAMLASILVSDAAPAAPKVNAWPVASASAPAACPRPSAGGEVAEPPEMFSQAAC